MFTPNPLGCLRRFGFQVVHLLLKLCGCSGSILDGSCPLSLAQVLHAAVYGLWSQTTEFRASRSVICARNPDTSQHRNPKKIRSWSIPFYAPRPASSISVFDLWISSCSHSIDACACTAACCFACDLTPRRPPRDTMEFSCSVSKDLEA